MNERRPVNGRQATPAQWRTAFAILVAAALAAGAIVFYVNRSTTPTSSQTPAATLAAGFDCAPQSAFSNLFAGHHGSVRVQLGALTALYSASVPPGPDQTAHQVGMPFNGTLTLSQGPHVWPVSGPSSAKGDLINQLCVIRFGHERHPAVLSEGFSGGAHCCELPVLYAYDTSNGHYVKVLDLSNFNTRSPVAFDDNAGFIPKAINNQVLLETGDGAFAYRFGCYACTPMPLRLDAFVGHHLVDVTAKFPTLVAAEAASLWGGVQSAVATEKSTPGVGPFGEVAAWVADECTPHRGASAWSKALVLRRAGVLSDAAYHLAAFTKRPFLADLRSFLLAHHYCAGQLP